MADVFDAVLGQARAVAAMRHHVRHPVHAYLLTGPPGCGLREALDAFIAGLQCPEGGCGICEVCRLVEIGEDPDVTIVEREGVSWSTREFAEAERVSRRRPLGRGHQIVVIENVELSQGATSKLLKILEEPPTRTIFLLTAESMPETLSTIVSRCLEIGFHPLGEEVIAEYLMRQGFDAMHARAAASAAGGDLRRAQVLARDEALAQRVATWQDIPDRLDTTTAHLAALAQELSGAIDEAVSPLVALQGEEMARMVKNAQALGLRSLSGRREIEARFRREQRRFRLDDLRFGLSALTLTYRARLLESLEGMEEGERRQRLSARGNLEAIELIDAASRLLGSNVDETLLLTDLMLSLSRC